eukprot:gnl/TRDRNA2_/TRDRNA2_155039_c0_seq1.p1 gnl/TRDRNA2_/TRDRNA2_155039_c0~~gnl/TRDRNA2_/TRDRNA2_155039_c0_seq1.p1  ORF type:complete len:389 (+),score=81.13 gnl/TRDRNA2_/TRDRNA2_155039_c0_seq1:33-1199(+)
MAAGDGIRSGTSDPLAALLELCLATAPLRSACVAGDLAAVKQSLPHLGVRSSGARGGLQGAVSSGHAEIVRFLLEEGVPPEPPESGSSGASGGSSSSTATGERLECAPYVIQAALANSPDTLQVLADYGLHFEERGLAAILEHGRGAKAVRAGLFTTALGAAAWGLKLEALEAVARLQLEQRRSADDDADDIDALTEVRPLTGGGSEPSGSKQLQERFSWAHGSPPLLLALLAAWAPSSSASVSAAASNGTSAEASSGDVAARRAAEMLLRYRADACARNAAGDTALHVAARFGFVTATTLLLRAGADPSLRNGQGDAPEAVAVRAGRTACVGELRAFVADGSTKLNKAQELPPPQATDLEQEEERENARLERLKEKQKEKRSAKMPD